MVLTQLAEDNASGVIDVGLITKAMNTIGLPYTQEELAGELARTDTDGDGQLEVHEFEANLRQQAALCKAGLEGALEPWDLGRCLAVDALPLAARAYTAHAAVDEAIKESESRLAPPKRMLRKADQPPPLLSPQMAQLRRGLKTPLGVGKGGEPKPPKRTSPSASPRPPAAFTVWEETKEDFAECAGRCARSPAHC